MIKVELEISDIDYDRLIDQYLPFMLDKLRQSGNPASRLVSAGMPASMARAVLKKLPQTVKDQLAVELFNANKAVIRQFLSDAARQNQVGLQIGDLKAKTY